VRISDTCYEDLPPLLPQTMSAPGDDLRLPLLADVFEEAGVALPIIVELKQDSDLLIAKVHGLIELHRRRHTTVWFSLSASLNAKLHR